jgi:hypothetical protein
MTQALAKLAPSGRCHDSADESEQIVGFTVCRYDNADAVFSNLGHLRQSFGWCYSEVAMSLFPEVLRIISSYATSLRFASRSSWTIPPSPFNYTPVK